MSWTYSETRDRHGIEAYLRRRPFEQLYSLGDLSDHLWPRTRWHVAKNGAEIEALFMVFETTPQHVLLAMEEDTPAALWLLEQLRQKLPEKVYAHAADPLLARVSELFRISDPTPYRRMGLLEPRRLDDPIQAEGVRTRRLDLSDLQLLKTFYQNAYQQGWFSDDMLVNGVYFGAFAGAELVAVAGSHIYAPTQGVAALGNIATRPDWRGKNLATLVTREVCRALRPEIQYIGLNVRADNAPARRCYEKLGFRDVTPFHEFYAEA